MALQPESATKCILYPILQNAAFEDCTTSSDNDDLAVGLWPLLFL